MAVNDFFFSCYDAFISAYKIISYINMIAYEGAAEKKNNFNNRYSYKNKRWKNKAKS